MIMFKERENALAALQDAASLRDLSLNWQIQSADCGYSYTKDWFGLPIIQRTDDIIQMSELIFNVKPTCIIETGVARGGSIAFYASMLCLLDLADNVDPRVSNRRVIGIDIDIREANLQALQSHPFSFKSKLIQGSSIDPEIVSNVKSQIKPEDKVMVILDSNHSDFSSISHKLS